MNCAAAAARGREVCFVRSCCIVHSTVHAKGTLLQIRLHRYALHTACCGKRSSHDCAHNGSLLLSHPRASELSQLLPLAEHLLSVTPHRRHPLTETPAQTASPSSLSAPYNACPTHPLIPPRLTTVHLDVEQSFFHHVPTPLSTRFHRTRNHSSLLTLPLRINLLSSHFHRHSLCTATCNNLRQPHTHHAHTHHQHYKLSRVLSV